MRLNKVLKDFHPNKIGLKKVLGHLEADVMEIVWAQKKATVREVYDVLRQRRDLAYTTVMTIMTRLAEKGILQKEKVGNAYLYAPVLSKNELLNSVVTEVIDGLLADFAEPAMTHFVDRMSKEDEVRLEMLEKLIQERKQKQQQ